MVKSKKEINVGIHNRFDIEVINAKTGEVKQKAQAFNIVLNRYWTQLLAADSGSTTSYIQYGSGSGTPSISDVSLFHREGSKQAGSASQTNNIVTQVATIRRSITLGVSDANGINLTEVGYASGDSDGTLTTHAMLQDMNGNPISIQKTDTDVINIYATIYVHCTSTDGVYFINADSYLGGLGGLVIGSIKNSATVKCEAGCGPTEQSQYITTKVIDATNKRVTYKYRFNVDEANLSGIDRINVMMLSTRENSLAWIENTWSPFNITNESVGVGDGTTVKFKTKTGYPYNAKVYINGVEQVSGVTVKKLPCINTTQMSGQNATDSLYNGRWVKAVDSRSTLAKQFHTCAHMSNIRENTMADYGEGLYRFTNSAGEISNDLVNWTTISANTDLTEAQRRYKFIRFTSYPERCRGTFDGNNIVFDTPPANGDIITIDYNTDYIPKDADHVLDVELTLQFGDYQGE